jgi:hypothetical protein
MLKPDAHRLAAEAALSAWLRIAADRIAAADATPA